MLTFRLVEAQNDLGDGKKKIELFLSRAKVPGGWLVLNDERMSLTFVPDPDHEWDGSSLDDG